jgi:mannose-1-phosphate guanylyltransferase
VRRNDGKPLKSMVLAAGLGTRLRPLTHEIPKPLATVCDVPLFDAAVRLCVKSGAVDLAVNTHHLNDVMSKYAQETFANLGARSLFISHETTILGTGGALSAIKDWWGEALLLVYNGDILSGIPLDELVARHRSDSSLVSLAVHSSPPTDGGRSVWVGPDGLVQCIAKASDLPPTVDKQTLTECGFACAYVASPELREFLPNAPEVFDVILAFNAALKAGHTIRAVPYNGFWADIGQPRSLWEANLAVWRMSPAERLHLLGVASGMGHDTRKDSLHRSAADGSSVISASARVGKGAKVIDSVLLAGAVVQDFEVFERGIRGYGLDQVFVH